MTRSGLLNFRRCCALILEGSSQVGIIPNCVSSEGRSCFVVPFFTTAYFCLC